MNFHFNSKHWNTVGFLLSAFMLATTTFPAIAEVPSDTKAQAKRPKVCLVLSGGGARGAAHVGVLKVLEEYRVPIDCIAGTSMGALVGAAYASGTSVPDMEKLLASLNTNTLFQDEPPREELHIRRKQEDRSLLFSPELGLGSVGGDMLPKGIVTGVQLESVLREISAPGYRDFDKMPIPFRAVSTDLVTGKAVVFDKGELANVMRSSMSVPVAIAPVEVGGQLLVDGMLVNNLPIDVGRAMGADVIIAVNVGTPLLKREQLGSILGIAGQMISILTEQNVQAALASLKPSDILISPELGDFATSDFDDLPSTLPIGEAAARKVADQLSQLSLSPDQYAAYRKNLHSLLAQDLRPVDKVRFEKLSRVNPEYAESLLTTKPGKEINQDELDADMRRLYGTGDFEHVKYRILDEDGQRVLAVDAVEKNWGPNYFRFGLGLEHDFAGETNATLQARYRRTWVNSLGAEWLTDVQIGSTDRIGSEFYQPLDGKHRYFVAPKLELKRTTNNLYEDGRKLRSYDIERYRAGFDIGRDIYEYGQIRLGVVGGVIKQSVDIGENPANDDDFTEGAFTASLQIDKLDSVAFPTAGWNLLASLYNANSALGADDDYTKWQVGGIYLKTFGRHTFNLGFYANGSLDGGSLPSYDQNSWGGFLRQSGYSPGQMFGESLTFGRLMYYHKLVDYQMFDGLYAGFSLEMGKMDNPFMAGSPSDTVRSASAFIATDSPIGPVYLGYGAADDGNDSLYLFVGYPY
jgi:NTE family protein